MAQFFKSEKWHSSRIFKGNEKFEFSAVKVSATRVSDTLLDLNRRIPSLPTESPTLLFDNKKIQFKELTTETEADSFFKERVLSGLNSKGEGERLLNALDFCQKYFHQGALLGLTSGALTTKLLNAQIGRNGNKGGISGNSFNITPTNDGFLVTEALFYKNKGLVKDGKPLESKNPGENLLDAQVTFKVVFDDKGNAKVTMVETHISYGNDDIEKILDNRNWIEILIDWLDRLSNGLIFGDITPKYKLDQPSQDPS